MFFQFNFFFCSPISNKTIEKYDRLVFVWKRYEKWMKLYLHLICVWLTKGKTERCETGEIENQEMQLNHSSFLVLFFPQIVGYKRILLHICFGCMFREYKIITRRWFMSLLINGTGFWTTLYRISFSLYMKKRNKFMKPRNVSINFYWKKYDFHKLISILVKMVLQPANICFVLLFV